MKGRRDQNCMRNTGTIVGRAEETDEKEVRTVCVPITVQFFPFMMISINLIFIRGQPHSCTEPDLALVGPYNDKNIDKRIN